VDLVGSMVEEALAFEHTPRTFGRCASFKGRFSVAPCQTLIVRFATNTSLCGGDAVVLSSPRASHPSPALHIALPTSPSQPQPC
jgi:hypothetical protein